MYVYVGQLQAELHPFNVEKLDACIRPLYPCSHIICVHIQLVAIT